MNWVTLPARAPNFGGIWEIAVKSMKLLWRKTIGKTSTLRMNEIYRITCQIGKFLNLRKTTTVSDDSRDHYMLTSGMLLDGFKRISLRITV